MADVPLIWTSKGNLPIASLAYRHEWIVNDEEIVFAEEYLLEGELVKRSAHVYKKKGVVALLTEGKIGG